MKTTGIIRKVDDLGRIVLPIELRRSLDIGEHDEMEIYVEGNMVILKKYEVACIFCGRKQNVVQYHKRNVCKDCIREMGAFK